MDRKSFIQASTAAGVGFSMMPFNILKEKDDRKVKLGFIGVGSRGTGHLRGILNRTDVEVPALCDIDSQNAERAQKMVLDAATSAAIVALSEKSIAQGGSAVPFPDFTRGKWVKNKPIFLPEELGY